MKMRISTFITIAIIGLSSISAEARPVSYVGGWTFIEQTDRQMSALWVHYTLNPSLSIGWRSEWDRQDDFILSAPQATYLVKRWFGEDYQANVYAFGGAGVLSGIKDNNIGTEAAGFVGILADWETRRFFASYRARYLGAESVETGFMQAARFGFAPYKGDTGDLHTWLMVEVDHRPNNDDKVGVTPLVRFFKGSALFEAGWSLTDNQPLVNFTYRF